jgi:hypothetical protein
VVETAPFTSAKIRALSAVVMNRRHQLYLVLMAGGVAAGCGTPQINRIDRNRDVYESWPIDTKQAVLDGKVEPGMTPDMVRVAWGEPSEKVSSSSGSGEEIWVYRKPGEDPTMMGPMYPGVGMGGMYPGGGIGMGGGPGIGIVTGGRGMGTGVYSTGGIGIGGGLGGGGPILSPAPIMTPGTPSEEKEVVFRDGVVYRADGP